MELISTATATIPNGSLYSVTEYGTANKIYYYNYDGTGKLVSMQLYEGDTLISSQICDYDDYEIGGCQRIGNSNGNTPRNNRNQNRQFRDATSGLSNSMRRRVHDKISGKGLGYHEIKKIAKELLKVVIITLNLENDD